MTLIDDKYAALGGAAGSLGSPTSPETTAPDGYGSFRKYQHGAIYASPATGAHALWTALDGPYTAGGATSGALGYPIVDDALLPDGSGRFAVFQRGALHVDAGGARTVAARHGRALTATAIPVVGSGGTGIHVSWTGPTGWPYAPGGFWVQRRIAPQSSETYTHCISLGDTDLQSARTTGELATSLGTLLARHAFWPYGTGTPPPCDALRLELAALATAVDITAPDAGADAFCFALRDGKVCAGPVHGAHVTLRGGVFDTIVIYLRGAKNLKICVRDPALLASDEASWDHVPYIAQGLQLPFKAVDTAISDEYEVAAARVPGGGLAAADFWNVAGPLDETLPRPGGIRPIEQIVQWRDDGAVGGGVEESGVLDPLRMALLHPTWRRALGTALFDQSGLTVGASYQYRITGVFPVEDLEDAIYAFHTIPTGALIPTDFYLRDLRVRLAQPSRVTRVPTSDPGPKGGRRGVPFASWAGVFALFGELVDPLAGGALVLDLAAPVSTLVIEVAEAGGVSYAASAGGSDVVATTALPAARARLSFPTPVDQVRLYGSGTLLSVRVPGTDHGLAPFTLTLPPVTLVDTPLLPAPASLAIANLQQTTPAPSDAPPPEIPATRHALGFELTWPPTLAGDAWPTSESAAAPTTALAYQLQHRGPDGVWEDVIDGDHYLFGTRAGAAPDPVRHGCDLLAIYPETRPPAPTAQLSWRDAFSADVVGHPARRPTPAPGTKHAYRIRTIDAIGRPSATWTTSAELMLEKHVPPPLPAAWDGAWQLSPGATVPDPITDPKPSGVFATVLQSADPAYADQLAAQPDLTDDERATLAALSGNAVILRWGWHQTQRDQDPYAREFRIYTAPPLDVVPGTLTGWTAIAGGWRLQLTLDRAVAADDARGLQLDAGYPFTIETHTAGTTITADTSVAIRNPDGSLPVPVAGPILLPIRYRAQLTRPPAWRERVIVPLTDAEQYHHVFINLLTLDDTHARDAMWVGVSSADAQTYVPDQRPADGRPGNESAIVVAVASARSKQRPVLAYVPPLADVQVVAAPEPAGRPVTFDLDCVSALPPGLLAPGDAIIPQRVSAAELASKFRADPAAGTLRALAIAARDGEPADYDVPDFAGLAAEDRAALLAGLAGSRLDDLADKYLVWLAARHPLADRLFVAGPQGRVPAAPFRERLPPAGGRWLYRLRKASAAGALSEGAAYPALVVRVPGTTPGGAPETEIIRDAGAVTLRLRTRSDVDHVLVFSRTVAPDAPLDTSAELLRVPNRPDLATALDRMLVVRTTDGLLRPQVEALSDPDGDGYAHVDLAFIGPAGQIHQVWTCSVTRDRVPSRLVGPLRITIPGASDG